MINIDRVYLGGQIYNLREFRTKNDKTYVRFSLLTFKKNREGEEDTAMFHPVISYGGKAEAILKYFKNKDMIIIDGSLDTYKNKEGKDESVVVLDQFFFVGNKESA
jgi:single-stranded DNA-binding protein